MAIKRSVLSLFSGCGGLDLGFVQAGFNIQLAIDHWGPAVSTYRANKRLLQGEVLQKSLSLKDQEVSLSDLPPCEVVLGGPPCQGFSFAGRQFKDDPRNLLYKDFVTIVQHIGPRVFLMENVRGMEAMALDQVKADFTGIGYDVSAEVAEAVNFGVPQRRERLLIIGFRKDLKVTFRPPDSGFGNLFQDDARQSIMDAIGDLPRPFEVTGESEFGETDLPGYLRNHAFRPLPDAVQRFVRHIPNGGSFRDAPRECLPERLQKILDDPVRYRSPRLFPKPSPTEPSQTVPADTNPSLGGVLAPDLRYDSGRAEPVNVDAHTIDGLYTSPYPSRRITPREAARLQTFPDDFEFVGSLSTQHKQIGNAVPVKMARKHAEHILDYLTRLDATAAPLVKRER